MLRRGLEHAPEGVPRRRLPDSSVQTSLPVSSNNIGIARTAGEDGEDLGEGAVMSCCPSLSASLTRSDRRAFASCICHACMMILPCSGLMCRSPHGRCRPLRRQCRTVVRGTGVDLPDAQSSVFVSHAGADDALTERSFAEADPVCYRQNSRPVGQESFSIPLKATMGIGLLPISCSRTTKFTNGSTPALSFSRTSPRNGTTWWRTLTEFRFHRSWITVGGGRKSKVSEAIDSSLYSRGWAEKQFATEIVIDGSHTETPTHQIDCFKNRIALEIEWNNKDPFFDRDLNNFRLLFELRAVSVGVIITRCDNLQEIFQEDRPWNELWCFHDAHEQIAAAPGGRRRGWLPDPRVRHQPVPLLED
jgi:hypothetical protein